MPTFYPKALPKIISPGSNDPRIIPVGLVCHVAVSNADSLHDFFVVRDGIESHFYVRFDGTVEQYRDCDFEADAQGAGNSWTADGKRFGYLSVETAGMGDGSWTEAQLDALEALARWASGKFEFPLRQTPSPQPSAASRGGLGYHRLFSSWNVNGHSCPGDARVKQFNTVLLPRLKEDPDVQLTDNVRISPDETLTVAQVLKYILLNARKVKDLQAELDELKASVADVRAVVGLGDSGLKLSYLLTPVEE